MTEWVRYDATNKPDSEALVRVRRGSGFETGWYMRTRRIAGWAGSHLKTGNRITHFMLKPARHD